MSGATFGRKGAAPSADLAARRAAFLAEERARAAAAPAGEERQPGVESGFARAPLADRPYIARKSNGTAYLLWFFLGGFSAHRFYLGFPASGIIQLLLTPIGYAMLLSKSPAGLIFPIASGLWILADAFLIPSLVTKANERSRGLSLTSTFA
jgi:TM2 domain-containing membrane protein YozV